MELVSNTLNLISENEVVVWLAHSEELCEQACECFIEIWQHVGRHGLWLNRVWGNANLVVPDWDRRTLIVGSFQKLYALLRGNTQLVVGSRRVRLIVVDEAHKVVAPTYEEVTRRLIGASTSVIGLTATPGRSYHDDAQNEALSDFFFGNIIQIPVPGPQSAIGYLRDRGVLSRLVVEPLHTNRTYVLDERELENVAKFYDFSPRFLRALGEDDLRNVSIILSVREHLDAGRQTLYFGTSVEQSKFVSAVLSSLGYSCAHVDGNTRRNVRRVAIERFKTKEIQFLCNYGVLSTGFDAPQTDVVVIARPTQSIVLYSQMIGRGLRGPAMGGTSRCIVVNIVDNIVGLPREEKIGPTSFWSIGRPTRPGDSAAAPSIEWKQPKCGSPAAQIRSGRSTVKQSNCAWSNRCGTWLCDVSRRQVHGRPGH